MATCQSRGGFGFDCICAPGFTGKYIIVLCLMDMCICLHPWFHRLWFVFPESTDIYMFYDFLVWDTSNYTQQLEGYDSEYM